MEEKNQAKYFLAILFAMVIWGIAWPVGKTAVLHSNPEIAAFWRYMISFAAFIPVVLFFKVSFKTDIVGYIYMIAGGLLTALYNYLFFKGLSVGESGYGGTLVTTLSPVFTYLLSIMIFQIKISKKQILALAVGVAGAIILLKIPTNGFGFLNITSLYFVEAAVIWSAVTIIAQKVSQRANPIFYTLVVFFIVCAVSFYFASPYHPLEIKNFDNTFWYSILYLGVFSGAFSMGIYIISAGKIGAHTTSIFMFIVPVSAIISSWIIYNEKITLSTVIGSILAFTAVVLFNSKKR
jgi:drug/metabolite transporter (DMT)-like permease